MAVSPALRRRAACAALSPYLDEDALYDALRLLHETLRGDAVSDLIRYIDAVAERHGLDAATRKRLYSAYFDALRQPESSLPMDPWPAMQAASGRAPAPAATWPPAPAPVAAVAPVASWQAAALPAVTPPPAVPAAIAPEPVAAPVPVTPVMPVTPAAPTATPAAAVHGHLMRAMLAEVRQFHPGALADLRDCALDQLAASRVGTPAREAWRDSWARAVEATWLIEAAEPVLAELVNLSYVALCEALGPVDADRVLTRAVRQAEQSAEARQFSPRRLV